MHGFAWNGPVLQLGGSLIAVLLLAAYVRLVWDRRPAPPLDPGRALALFAAEHPEARPREALVTADGRAALVRTEASGELGLVAAFGARWRTRLLDRHAVAALDAAGDGGVRLVLREIAQPPLLLRFDAAADHAAWLRPLHGDAR